MDSTYMTTLDVANLLRTSPESIRYWRFVGKGPASFKLGRKVLYDRAEVETWIAAARAAQTTAAAGGAA